MWVWGFLIRILDYVTEKTGVSGHESLLGKWIHTEKVWLRVFVLSGFAHMGRSPLQGLL